MGCCASERQQPNPAGHQKVENTQPTGATNVNTSISKPPPGESVNPHSPSNPNAPHPAYQIISVIPVGGHIAVSNQNSNQVNKSGVAGSNINPYQPGNRSEIKGVQQNHSPYVPTHAVPQLHNQNDTRLVELDHVKELASYKRENIVNTRVNERAHGQQQILQTYHQNFEIPVFSVGLTAH